MRIDETRADSHTLSSQVEDVRIRIFERGTAPAIGLRNGSNIEDQGRDAGNGDHLVHKDMGRRGIVDPGSKDFEARLLRRRQRELRE